MSPICTFILIAFLAGLALGIYLMRRSIDRPRSPFQMPELWETGRYDRNA